MIEAGLLAGKGVVAKNAMATLLAGGGLTVLSWLSFDPSAFGIPGLVLGAIGGSSRWIALKERWREGVVSVVIGAMAGWTFDGAAIIPLENLIRMSPERSAIATSVIMGVLGVVLVRGVDDVGDARRLVKAAFEFIKGKVLPS